MDPIPQDVGDIPQEVRERLVHQQMSEYSRRRLTHTTKCQECGKPLEGVTTRRKYCSPACFDRGRNRRRQEALRELAKRDAEIARLRRENERLRRELARSQGAPQPGT